MHAEKRTIPAKPRIPKIGPNNIKPTIKIPVEIILLVKTNLLFSNPKSFEV